MTNQTYGVSSERISVSVVLSIDDAQESVRRAPAHPSSGQMRCTGYKTRVVHPRIGAYKGFRKMKIKSMAFNQLIMIRAQIQAEIETRIARQRIELIEAIGELRKTSPDKSRSTRDGRSHPLKDQKLPPRYRNPKDRNETWAGRGNRPRWLTAALKSGKKLEAFAI